MAADESCMMNGLTFKHTVQGSFVSTRTNEYLSCLSRTESDVSSPTVYVVVSGPISEVSDQRLSGICDTPRGLLRLNASEHDLQFGVVSLQFDEENITNWLKTISYFECCPLSEGTEGYFSK